MVAASLRATGREAGEEHRFAPVAMTAAAARRRAACRRPRRCSSSLHAPRGAARCAQGRAAPSAWCDRWSRAPERGWCARRRPRTAHRERICRCGRVANQRGGGGAETRAVRRGAGVALAAMAVLPQQVWARVVLRAAVLRVVLRVALQVVRLQLRLPRGSGSQWQLLCTCTLLAVGWLGRCAWSGLAAQASPLRWRRRWRRLARAMVQCSEHAVEAQWRIARSGQQCCNDDECCFE